MSGNPQRLTAEDRRRQILECAAGVFSQSNYTAAKVADIARAAGISEAMLYKHFSSKKEIFLNVLQELAGGLDHFWEISVETDADPLAALKTVTMLYYREVMKHPEALRLQFLALLEVHDPDILVQLQDGYRGMVGHIRAIIERGVAQGVVRKDIDMAAVTNLGLAGGLLTHVMSVLTLQSEYPEELVERMVDHLIESIKTH